MDEDREFDNMEVGYGRPPKRTQFQKGKSGNPSGRPKGSKNLSTILLQDCNQRVRVNGPKGSRLITKLQAAVIQLGNKTVQGDLRASQQYFALVRSLDDSGQADLSLAQPHERDAEMIQSMLRRIQKTFDSPPHDTPETTKHTGETE